MLSRPAPQAPIWQPSHPRALGVRLFVDMASARGALGDLTSRTGATAGASVSMTASPWGRSFVFSSSAQVVTIPGRGLSSTPAWFTGFCLLRYDSASAVESEILVTSSTNAGLGIQITSGGAFSFGLYSVVGVSSGITLTASHTYALAARWTQSGSNNIRFWAYDYTAGGTLTTAAATNNSTPLAGNGNATINPNFGNLSIALHGALSLAGCATAPWDDATFVGFARDPFAPARPSSFPPGLMAAAQPANAPYPAALLPAM